jgi:hypothetical protein
MNVSLVRHTDVTHALNLHVESERLIASHWTYLELSTNDMMIAKRQRENRSSFRPGDSGEPRVHDAITAPETKL